MKKLMALAMVSMFVGSAATSWALIGLEDVSYDGSLEVSGISANNEADKNDAAHDHNGGVNTRLLLGINAGVTEGIKARIQLSRTGEQYGRRNGTSTGAGDGSNANSLHDELGAIAVQNAYVDIENIIWGVGGILGRQYVGEAGDLVWNIAPTDNDALSVGAIDGLTLNRDWEHLNAMVFFGKATENSVIGATNGSDINGATINPTVGDVNLNSFDLYNKTLIPGGRINLGYLWGESENMPSGTSTGAPSTSRRLNTTRFGVKGGIAENMFTYNAELFVNGGEQKGTTNVDYEGAAMDLGFGVNIIETAAGGFTGKIGILVASGDDNTTDGKDESFHDFTVLGVGTSDRVMGEIFGKSAVLTTGVSSIQGPGGGVDTGVQGQGMDVFNIGGSWTPPILESKLKIALDFWSFNTVEDGATSRNPNADEYGNEFDLVFTFAHSDNTSVDFGYAMFEPGNAIVGTTPGIKDDTITKLFARAKIGWGGEE